jgi:hypothetical protein
MYVLGPVYIHRINRTLATRLMIAAKAFIGFFVACGDASKDFDAAEEVFDEMPPLVFFAVVLGVSAGPLAERYDGLGALFLS